MGACYGSWQRGYSTVGVWEEWGQWWAPCCRLRQPRDSSQSVCGCVASGRGEVCGDKRVGERGVGVGGRCVGGQRSMSHKPGARARLQCSTVQYVQHSIVQHSSAEEHSAAQLSPAQCRSPLAILKSYSTVTVLHRFVQYSTVQYSTVPSIVHHATVHHFGAACTQCTALYTSAAGAVQHSTVQHTRYSAVQHSTALQNSCRNAP